MASRLLLKTPPPALCALDGPAAEETMGLAKRQIGGLLITGVAMLAAPPSASPEERVGVVTNLEGVAMVARVALPEPRPLQFKDDVYVRDRISTGERSIVRVLLGGKATVTARERSVLTITESPGVATIDLGAGRISVAVSKGLMKRGEVVEIKTPNAVSAIRGTIVIAEVFPDENLRSTISVLRGLVDVTRLDKGRRVGPSVNVGALQSVTVIGSRPLAHPSPIPSAQAKRLTSDFRIVPTQVPPAAAEAAAQHAMKQATEHAKTAIAVGGMGSSTTGPRTVDGDSDAGAGDSDRVASGRDGDRDAGLGEETGNANRNVQEPNKGSRSGSDAVDGAGANAAVTTSTGNSGGNGGSVTVSVLAAPPAAIESPIGSGSGKKGRK